jgi:asparagine synthase (glutamine-hydrolysing)
MCGFAGFVTRASFDEAAGKRQLSSMCHAIARRGPDGEGLWVDDSRRVALGHRRLAIIDLSSAGSQPMHSQNDRWTLVFNGEIYNHLELRAELEAAGVAPAWRGHSDTETLLAGFQAWGVEPTIRRTIGMFGFAVWDEARQSLTLGRDRLGEKPVYYGWHGTGSGAVFLFGSELGALRAHPAFVSEIDRNALCLYLRNSCVGGDHSIFKNVRKLPPGSLLTLAHDRPAPNITTFWSARDAVLTGVRNPFDGSPEEAVDRLDTLLSFAIRRQMVADVPLGAFLSGGVDSSTVVALMQAQSVRPVKTFSIGFYEKGYDEAQHAKAVAEHLGTEHTTLYVTSEEAMAVIPKLPSIYSEPFADSSQIPTFLVSELAREQVIVSLSGDAGDELFSGYNRYHLAGKMWRKLHAVPQSVRRIASRSIRAIPPHRWDLMLSAVTDRAGEKLYKAAGAIISQSASELYRSLTSAWDNPAQVVIDCSEPDQFAADEAAFAELGTVERMMALDLTHYLPDDILTKVDRAGMAVSLESRIPMLDHELVEFAWSLPLHYKLREGTTKWPLRQLLYRHVPRELIERPKMGFGVPIGIWLRGPLREWAEELLAEKRLRQEGFFHAALIRRKWQEHLSGHFDWQSQLWNVLMFQAWYEENIGR